MQNDSNPDVKDRGPHSAHCDFYDSSESNWFTPPNDGFPYRQIYEPLNARGCEIRLLRLVAGKQDDPIECQLINNVVLPMRDSTPSAVLPYDAICYCAGDPSDYRKISLNGHSFNVFASLCAGLNYLRSPTDNRLVWVDQICIQLKNETERISQVLEMKEIYRNATSVQIWLGEASLTARSNLFFDLMDEFMMKYASCFKRDSQQRLWRSSRGEIFQRQLQRVNTDHGLLLHIPYRNGEAPFVRRNLDEASSWLVDRLRDPAYEAVWTATQNILGRPLWRRCWVIQEIVTSTAAQVNCGYRSINWIHFMALIVALCMAITEFHAPAGLQNVISSPLLLDLLRDHRMNSPEQPVSLSVLLSCFRSWQSSDSRDKIFSLLGLLSAGQQQMYQLSPDYTQENTVVDVLVRTAKSIILAEKNFDILGCVVGDEISQGIPSWAPDWTRPVVHNAPHPEYHVDLTSISRDLTPNVEFMEQNRVLKMSGWVFDIIKPHIDLFSNTHSKDHEQGKITDDAVESESFLSNHNKVLLTGGISALIPAKSFTSDKICIPVGAETAYTIRPREDSYILIGRAYFWGLTEGALVEWHKTWKHGPLQMISLR